MSEHTDHIQSVVQAEQLRLLYKGLILSLPASFLAACMFVLVHRIYGINTPHAWLWISIMLVVSVGRAIDGWLYYRQPTIDTSNWGSRFLIGTIAGGMSWGLASWMIYPLEDAPMQALFVFGIAAVSAGALISLAFVWSYFLAFMLFAVGSLCVRLIFDATALSYIMAAVLLFYWAYVSLASRIIDKTTRQNLELRLRASEREKTLHAIQQRQYFHVQHTQLMVIEWNTQLQITEWNPAAENITGYTHAESIGEYLPDFINPEDAHKRLAGIWAQMMASRQPVSIEYPVISRDQQHKQCAWHITPLLDEQDEIIGGASMALDITERKAAQTKLQLAKDEAEKANRAKSEFLSSMSHELRTPLNAIIGFSQLILSETKDEDTRENSELINNAGGHLLNLINDLLDLEKIEAGKLTITTELISVSLILEECMPLVLPMASKRSIDVRMSSDMCNTIVQADQVRLKQCFLNFLTNAIKYGFDGGYVEISCEPTQDQYLRISFTDNGHGISKDLQEKLFTAFDRLGRETSQVEGNGIGLVITRQLIEMMGGRIGFESEPEVGSTFWVELQSTGIQSSRPG